MKLTQYLTVKEVLDLHDRTITKHGGSLGVRDMGLIESALYRAQSGYYNTLAEQASALLQSFCMNHPFVDGNKRVALLVSVVFLKMNGFNIAVSNQDFVKFIIEDVISKKADIQQLAKWFEARIEKI